MSGNLRIGDTINADLTVEDLTYLTDDLTILEGKTLTISSYGTIYMLNHDITIEETFDFERNSVVTFPSLTERMESFSPESKLSRTMESQETPTLSPLQKRELLTR